MFPEAAIAVGRPVTQPPPHTSRRAISPHQALQKYSLPQSGQNSHCRDAAQGQLWECRVRSGVSAGACPERSRRVSDHPTDHNSHITTLAEVRLH